MKLPLSIWPIRKLAYDRPVLAVAAYAGDVLLDLLIAAVSVTAFARVIGVEPPVALITL